MGCADDILPVTERLYHAAAAPEGWPSALEAVVGLLHGNHALLVGRGNANADGPFVTSAQVDGRDLARIFSSDGMRLTTPWFNAVPVGIALRAAFIPDADFARSAAYNDLIRPMNGFHSIHVRKEGAGGFLLNVCRPQGADNFDAMDTAALRSLVPHLATVLELQGRLQTAEQSNAFLARVLDRLETGVILIDGSARPVMLNACAERIIAEADGLVVDSAGLAAAAPAATRHLREAIAAMGRDTAIERRRIRLERPSHRLPLILTLLPIWRLGVTVPGIGFARVAVFITEPDAPLLMDRTAIAETFRLTRRESEIAALLADGLDRETIASRLGIAPGTVREHLRQVFAKARVRSQPALVALLRGFVDRLH
jgi:DNA-binding CsgD family transcriptional regulator